MKNVCDIFKECNSVCVVGISDKSYRDSYQVSMFLKNAGYFVVGVNPNLELEEINGIKIYQSLDCLDFKPDIINVFRRSEFIDELITPIINLKPKVAWLQLGIVNYALRRECEKHSIIYIDNKCIKIEYLNCLDGFHF